jgi:hypothetical protein
VERSPSGGWVYDVTTFGRGLVAVGTEHDPVGTGAGDPPPPSAAWVSADGASWVTASFNGRPNGALEFVAAGDRGVLALNGTESGYSQWRSLDGATWTGRDGPLKEVSDLAAIAGGFIAVGRETLASGEVRAVVWIAR